MNRSAEGARRVARRAVVTVCALIVIGLLWITGKRGGAGARAEGSAQDLRSPLGSALPQRAPAAGAQTSQASPAPKPELPSGRKTLRIEAGTEVIVYPPIGNGSGSGSVNGNGNGSGSGSGVNSSAALRAPVVMMLHGMCGDPLSVCDFWNRAGREGSWLVCPGGNVACGGARDWSGSGEVKAAALDESLAVTDKAYGAFIDHSQGDILVGYSRGAFVARDVVYARPGRFRGLILLGALMRPDAARLKASGIRRVVFAAGEWDMARPAMQRSAAALTGAGLPSRYVSLGQIGHALPDNLEAILQGALRWIREATPDRP